MRSPTCLLESRVYSSKNLRSAVQKDFYNTIGNCAPQLKATSTARESRSAAEDFDTDRHIAAGQKRCHVQARGAGRLAGEVCRFDPNNSKILPRSACTQVRRAMSIEFRAELHCTLR